MSGALRFEHISLGARFGTFGDAEIVCDYGVETNEPLPLDHPCVADMSFQGLLRVHGASSSFFLKTMLSADIDSLDHVGAGCHGLMLTAQGEIIDLIFVLRTGDLEYMLVTDAPVAEEAAEWLDSNSRVSDSNGRVFADVEVEDQGGSLSTLCMMGPGCSEMLDELAGADPVSPASFTGMLQKGLVFSDAIGSVPLMVATEPGLEGALLVWGSESGIAMLWHALMGFEELQAIGFDQLVSIKRSHGLWLEGVEDGRYLKPAEAGLGHLLRVGGGFVGAAAL